jgi:hypothetical protein
MIDYSQAILELRRKLHTVEKLMLSKNEDEAVKELESMSDICKFTAAWIENANHQ